MATFTTNKSNALNINQALQSGGLKLNQSTPLPASLTLPKLAPTSGFWGQYGIVPTPTPQKKPGEVLGINNSSGAGVSAGGSGMPELYEAVPAQPQFDTTPFDNAVRELDSQIAGYRQEGESDIANYTQQGQQRQGLISEQLTNQNKGFDAQRQSNEMLTEDAQNDIRRQYSQQQQGLQALYGGTTGTGKFATEILGSNAMQQFGKNQRSLQGVLTGIESQRATAISEANKLIFENDLRTQDQISQRKSEINAYINSLRNSQGMIRMDQQKQVMDTIRNYQQEVQAITARNASFKQNLYMQQTAFENDMKARQISAYKEFQPPPVEKLLQQIIQTNPKALSSTGRRYAEIVLGFDPNTLDDWKGEINPLSEVPPQMLTAQGVGQYESSLKLNPGTLQQYPTSNSWQKEMDKFKESLRTQQ